MTFFTSRSVGSARLGIALIVLILYGVAISVLASIPIPPENRDILTILFGNLGPLLGAIAGYYFNIDRKQASP